AFQAGSCPAGTIVGQATAASPLLSQPLSGNVELVDSGGTFPNLGLDLQGELHLLLQGAVSISSGNTGSFSNLPDIPIARFQLTFPPQPGLAGARRDPRAPPAPVFHPDFPGYNGKAASVDSAATGDGCGPSPCPANGKAKKKHHKRKNRALAAKKKRK